MRLRPLGILHRGLPGGTGNPEPFGQVILGVILGAEPVDGLGHAGVGVGEEFLGLVVAGLGMCLGGGGVHALRSNASAFDSWLEGAELQEESTNSTHQLTGSVCTKDLVITPHPNWCTTVSA